MLLTALSLLAAPALATEPAPTKPPSDAAPAGCKDGETVRFSCTTDRGKALALCASGDLASSEGTLQYRYGPADKPELVFPQTAAKAGFSWSVQTHAQSRSFHVAFTNDGHHYDVFDQMTEGSGRDHGAGVTVSRDGKLLATVLCDLDKPTHFAIAELESVLPVTPAAD